MKKPEGLVEVCEIHWEMFSPSVIFRKGVKTVAKSALKGRVK